jgi:hypothetical protein
MTTTEQAMLPEIESAEFYNLMQTYRDMLSGRHIELADAYEAVKTHIRAYASEAVRDALATQTQVLNAAFERMDRARGLLTDHNPRPMCNWGMLDTTDLRAQLATQAPALTDEQEREAFEAWSVQEEFGYRNEDGEYRDTEEVPGSAMFTAWKARALLAAASPTPTKDALDAKRLDFLESLGCFEVEDEYGLRPAKVTLLQSGDKLVSRKTLRKAIDAAISKGETP